MSASSTIAPQQGVTCGVCAHPAEVQPLLPEPLQPPCIRLVAGDDPERPALDAFVRRTFEHAYGAHIGALAPELLRLGARSRPVAVVGLRRGGAGPLFCEQYLPAPIERLIHGTPGDSARRATVVEIGNLAIAQPGSARLLIAMVTAFLHAAGARWVAFTAVDRLYNAFHRMGLQPQVLAPALPSCLPDGGRSWGSYYDHAPRVCVGDVRYGCSVIRRSIAGRQRGLHRWWRAACAAGAAWHMAGPAPGHG